MTDTGSASVRLCLGAAGASVIGALALLFLWKTGALNATTAYLLATIPVGLMVFAFVRGLSLTKDNARAAHRYLLRMALTMAFYLVTLLAAEHFIEDRGVTGWLAALLAFLPGLSFAGVIWIFGGLIVEEQDEFYRMLYVRQGLIATGISFTLAAIWGFLETYNIVNPVAAFWWPTIWCFGLGIGAIFNKLKYGTYGEIR
ncbi:hypothetical protein P7228_05475 [Altererythrobacter arenosus]|uniref:Uncharacterized protein n=1 Tax=Altererythrobacter arenosus TaxID=3032592 RepID=A0ABY8FUV3_9SPHN|nr:hypothetical protein [Altererythrobacter sp. CAU 1644]WFL78517.1 hypothetical protein P7228_05475 [Altererythrobacter sp. CAU 1644]